MKTYEKPVLETINFDSVDIITSSISMDDIIDNSSPSQNATVNFDELNL